MTNLINKKLKLIGVELLLIVIAVLYQLALGCENLFYYFYCVSTILFFSCSVKAIVKKNYEG